MTSAWSLRKEVGNKSTVDTYDSVIHSFARGELYMEFEAILLRMRESGISWNVNSFSGIVKGYRQSGLVDESKEQFHGIKASGILPSVLCCCMMLAVYAKNDRWDDAYELLDEMITNRVSSIHQVMGQMIKGDYDDGSNG